MVQVVLTWLSILRLPVQVYSRVVSSSLLCRLHPATFKPHSVRPRGILLKVTGPTVKPVVYKKKIESYLQKVRVYLNDSHGFNTLMLSFGEGGWDIPLLMRLQSLCTKSSPKYTFWDLGHRSIFLSY